MTKKLYENESNDILNEQNLIEELLNKNENKGIQILKDTRYFEKANNTTGRIEIWENALEIINQKSNYVFGK